MYHRPREDGVEFTSEKLSPKILSFHVILPNISTDNKFFNELRINIFETSYVANNL